MVTAASPHCLDRWHDTAWQAEHDHRVDDTVADHLVELCAHCPHSPGTCLAAG